MSIRLRFVVLTPVSLALLCGVTLADQQDACVARFSNEQLTATAQQNHKQVIKLSRRGLRECGENATLYFNMFMPLMSLGKEGEAEEALLMCLELDSSHVSCLKNLGNFYSHQGRYAEAVSQYEKALRIDERDDDAMDNMAVVRIREGKHAEAAAVASRAVDVNPSNIHARITLARAYLAGEKWREAIDTIDDAAYINPRYPGLRQAIGQVLYSAREPITRKAAKAKEDAWAQYYRARVTETVEEEVQVLEEVMSLGADQPRILAKYAYWLKPEEFQEAIDVLDKCLDIDPAFWPCLMLKGDRFRGAGKTSEARSAFEAGQEVAPFVPSFYWYLGLILAQQGDIEDALVQLEQGFDRGEDPLFRRLAAELYEKQGDLDKVMWHASRGAMAGDSRCREMVSRLRN